MIIIAHFPTSLETKGRATNPPIIFHLFTGIKKPGSLSPIGQATFRACWCPPLFLKKGQLRVQGQKAIHSIISARYLKTPENRVKLNLSKFHSCLGSISEKFVAPCFYGSSTGNSLSFHSQLGFPQSSIIPRQRFPAAYRMGRKREKRN